MFLSKQSVKILRGTRGSQRLCFSLFIQSGDHPRRNSFLFLSPVSEIQVAAKMTALLGEAGTISHINGATPRPVPSFPAFSVIDKFEFMS
jgi:hypothetical protein